jgi:hypothetical protein
VLYGREFEAAAIVFAEAEEGRADCKLTLIRSVGLAIIAPNAPDKSAEANFTEGGGKDGVADS